MRIVLLAIRMLNIQPENIVRDIMLIETSIYIMYIFLVIVVPSTLMITQCKSLKNQRNKSDPISFD